MAKTKATAQDFLAKMNLPADEAAPASMLGPATETKTEGGGSRSGLKHIGGYFDRDTVEKVAVLRARLDLDNSQLIKKAIEDLYSREIAARKFGDR